MGRHSKPDVMATGISETRLVEIRRAGIDAECGNGGLQDARLLNRCEEVLDRRGESWAASVLGRDISRRSRYVTHRPWLLDGESYALIEADAEEDRLSITHLDPVAN
ncbi:Uncharacterised protein [Mycobacteroides abscessus subsp. abscessus]|uniref:Uncharacterized protein n=2 Tax=Mycobacteroides abscessus TaxID=36809 RepID=A0A4D8S1L6_9MYCO|nr:hypothetical protein CFE69_23605 [Mycobacteroides abscessus subsp. massiliense]SHY28504.1 Uncharacterised protein [Mycobacteroides abscessus subsp. abscessus]SID71571.1 Uncharacterised protein [Mycobacteroides abscessus subsp. abscessus]SIK19018.1 Uncharacterised protein [Mycobacteroides abscessus subsp. abscessus]SIM43408.1 Uncharacterised protein [Mycobacteroides abscessus subsp. abscessus]